MLSRTGRKTVDNSDRSLWNKGVKSYHSDHYQLLTVKDVQKDEAAILAVLSAIKANELSNDLVLLNYYKEIPISFGATIDRIDRGVVDVGVHRLQAVSMQMQMSTFVKSGHLPYCVIAKVLRVKKEENLALLTQFSYVHIPSEQRKFLRVSVLEKVDAYFCTDKQEVHGTIGDISYGGVAILAPQETFFKENAEGMVTLCLRSTKLELPGTFIRVDEQHALKKYIIKLQVDSKSEQIISKFIFKEQIEILRELKDMCI
jgi:c-di-GMP-binding flagellar brake protein YcgR